MLEDVDVGIQERDVAALGQGGSFEEVAGPRPDVEVPVADARALVRGGAGALAALSSDAWFGGTSALPAVRRAGIAQQLAHLTLRVVETRTGAVRASSGGPAVVIAPSGRTDASAEAEAGGAGGVVQAPVRALAGRTLFVQTGDLAGPSAAVLLLGLLLLPPVFASRHGFS